MGTIAHARWLVARSGREGATPSRPLPVFTGAICAAALLLFGLDLGTPFEWSREAIARGEVWRLFTGHLAHWSLDHLLWDVAAVAVLGTWLERRHRGGLVALVSASVIVISLALIAEPAGLAAYRGLSGVASALFVAVALALVRDALNARDRLGAVAALVLLAGFAMKVIVELATGASLFAHVAESIEVTPLAHAMGCSVALAGGLPMRVGSKAGKLVE
jgi:rhomboid family GlyGly-CTERM serine protease